MRIDIIIAASASADVAGSSRECGAVLTSEARRWTSRGQGQGAASCRARVRIDATTCNLRSVPAMAVLSMLGKQNIRK